MKLVRNDGETRKKNQNKYASLALSQLSREDLCESVSTMPVYGYAGEITPEQWMSWHGQTPEELENPEYSPSNVAGYDSPSPVVQSPEANSEPGEPSSPREQEQEVAEQPAPEPNPRASSEEAESSPSYNSCDSFEEVPELQYVKYFRAGKCVHTNQCHQVHRRDISTPVDAEMCVACCRNLQDYDRVRFLRLAVRSSTLHSNVRCGRLAEQGGWGRQFRKCTSCWPTPAQRANRG